MNAKELQNRIEQLTDSERAEFARQFLSLYLSNGLGALTKRDIDSLVFFLLQKAIKGADVESYAWAKALRITPSRVGSLQLESHLKYAHLLASGDPQAGAQFLLSGLVDIQIGVDNAGKQLTAGSVRIQIDNPIARMEIEQAMKELGGVVDYERNRKLLKIDFINFLRLINKLTGENEDDIINRMARGKAKDTKKLAELLEEVKNAEYANLTEPGKLKRFVDLLGDTFAEKPKKLIEHIGLIFGSQKHQQSKG
jgi:hypothetical protein